MSVEGFHSKFGGMWIDRVDWEAQLAERLADGRLTAGDAANVRSFAEDGVIILPGAADLAAVDKFSAAVSQSFREGNPSLLFQRHGSQTTERLNSGVNRLGTRVVDAYMGLPQAIDLFRSPALLRFLTTVFDEPPLLFQSLSFDQGSQQGLHQDTAYVVVKPPMELAACWIALEDVQEGSGELMYVRGSHRFNDFDFGDHKHFDAQKNTQEEHSQWAKWLLDETVRRDLKLESFVAKKGDILIWHADLAHGGRPVIDKESTRRSLVGHFCPGSRKPNYFPDRGPEPHVRSAGALRYVSEHYLRFPEIELPLPEPEIEVERLPWWRRLFNR
jgi:ectoine hydroxylase-related dioxygenase (phytanoyl-CoA dioxygenase family)